MLTIQLLGMGCTKCKSMEIHLQKAIETLGIKASIERIEDIETLLSYGITGTPALIINGKVVSNNRVVAYEELTKLLGSQVFDT